MSRLTCLVPGCRHTRGPRKGEPAFSSVTEWICGEHWRGVPRTTRSSFFQARRGRGHYGPAFWWAECKRIAIERAAGL